jgi:hypothetical protein
VTPFTNTVMVVLTMMNSAGELSAVDKWLMQPAGYNGPVFMSVGECMEARGHLRDPGLFVCQIYVSAKEVDWTYHPPTDGYYTGNPVAPTPVVPQTQPAERSGNAPAPEVVTTNSFADVVVGPNKLRTKDRPWSLLTLDVPPKKVLTIPMKLPPLPPENPRVITNKQQHRQASTRDW